MIFAPHATDFYKVSHYRMYPKNTTKIYSNFTCRSDKFFQGLPDFDHKVVFFGLQAVIKNLLIETWNQSFFSQPKAKVIEKYTRRMDAALGVGLVSSDNFANLHDLGYLPLEIKALPEGSRVNMKVPLFTITNTLPDYYWLTNYVETQISAETWKVITSATTAYEYRRLLDKYSAITGAETWFTDWQAHDFSARGMCGLHDGAMSGIGHLTSFTGTDTVLAIDYAEDYYLAGQSGEVVGGSVSATEHSVMCAGSKEQELNTFRELIVEKYPSGIISIVSDTWDFWQVLTKYAQELKSEIMARDGKLTFRPDSGDPVDIVCGIDVDDYSSKDSLEQAVEWFAEGIEDEVRVETPHGECGDSEVTKYFRYKDKVYTLTVEFEWNRYDKQYYYIDGRNVGKPREVTLTPEQKGAVEVLWDGFGGTLTEKGYKTLDSHVGLIYGDSITLDRAQKILEKLKKKGFSSQNIVFGVGSYSYTGNKTRDSLGTAIKATYAIIEGESRELFKDPKTDVGGMKKSAKGLLRVEKEGNDFVLYDQQTPDQEKQGLLRTVFKDGSLQNIETFQTIRNRLKSRSS